VPVRGGGRMTGIALILNEEQLEHLSMLVAADMVDLKELGIEDPLKILLIT